jgi:hypothetical protein
LEDWSQVLPEMVAAPAEQCPQKPKFSFRQCLLLVRRKPVSAEVIRQRYRVCKCRHLPHQLLYQPGILKSLIYLFFLQKTLRRAVVLRGRAVGLDL